MIDEQGNWQWAVMPTATGLTFIETMSTDVTGDIYIGGTVLGQVPLVQHQTRSSYNLKTSMVSSLNWIPLVNGCGRLHSLPPPIMIPTIAL